jgi:hypothetical protein
MPEKTGCSALLMALTRAEEDCIACQALRHLLLGIGT